jgi:hypothetical protein
MDCKSRFIGLNGHQPECNERSEKVVGTRFIASHGGSGASLASYHTLMNLLIIIIGAILSGGQAGEPGGLSH